MELIRMWMLLFVTLRFFEIVGGVAVSELSIDSAFPAAVAGLVAPPGAAIVDVTNHPEFVIGCTFSAAVTNGTRSTAAAGDACVPPAKVKLVPSSAPAAQLTALEWTAIQTKAAAGDTVTARAAAQLLEGADLPHAQTAVSTLATQGAITALRATTINAALAIAAVSQP